jgi:hypothetical protein
MAFWHVYDSRQENIVLRGNIEKVSYSFSLDKSRRGNDMCLLFALLSLVTVLSTKQENPLMSQR